MTQLEAQPRAVIYARISMDRSGEALGVQRQIEDCKALAERDKATVIATLNDNDISAFSGRHRPGYDALLRLIEDNQVDAVYVWHMDRLHRSMVTAAPFFVACKEHRVSVRAVQGPDLDLTSSAGELTATILTAVAVNESSQKSERVSRARKQHAEMGRAHGHLGYGYDANQNIVPSEASVVREIARRMLDGETLYSIAKDLNERGVPTPGAGGWRHQHVNRVLAGRGPTIGIDDETCQLIRDLSEGASSAAVKSLAKANSELHVPIGVEIGTGQVAKLLDSSSLEAPVTTWRSANLAAMIRRGSLAGWRDFKPGARGGGPMVAQGTWTPILDKETTERIRALLDTPGRKKTGRHPKFLLTGVAECGTCGSRLAGTTDNRTNKRRYACNKIPGTDRCGRLVVAANQVDEMVTEAVLTVLADTPFRTARRRLRSTKDFETAASKLAELDDETTDWRADLESGRIDRGTFLSAMQGLERRRAPLEKVIGTHGPELQSALAGVPVGRAQINDWWAGASIEQQRRVVRALIECVVIRKADRPRGNVFDPSRVEPPVWRA